jgi:hypothetical protein
MNEFRTILETLDRLSAELDQLRDRREKIEERRDQVRSETYAKLTAEYDSKVSDAEQGLEAAADTLRRDLASLKSELTRLTGDVELADQSIEELELRRYIGEFQSDEDFASLMAGEKEKREKTGARLAELRIQVADAEAILGTSTVAGSSQHPAVITDTLPLPTAIPHAGEGTNPSAGPALEDTLDIRSADELSSTVAAPGDANPMPVFGDPSGLETDGGSSHVTVGGKDAPPAAVTLNYLDQTREVPIKGYPFTIGRSTKNTLSLKSEEISRYHSQIRFEKGKFLLEDLGSANGTKLDGKRIQRAELKPGGRITLGPAELTFTLSSS